MKLPTKSLLALLVLVPVISTSCVMGDCGWFATARAWIDQNENGVWDSNEKPLPNVVFRVADLAQDLPDANQDSKSDPNGEDRLMVGTIPCRDVNYEVYVDIPAGYRLTTPPRISARGKPSDEYGPYLFGFVRLPDVPAASPIATPSS